MSVPFVSEPELVYNNIDEEHYVYALCRCPLPLGYAIAIPRIEGKIAYAFKCKKCGTTGTVCIRGNNTKRRDNIHETLLR